MLPQVPQFWGSVWNVVRLTQVPPQLVVPLGHAHWPFEHTNEASGQHLLPHFFPLGQGAGLAAKAIPGMEARTPPTSAPPIMRSALRLERVPSASPLASSSKERSVVASSGLATFSGSLAAIVLPPSCPFAAITAGLVPSRRERGASISS